MDLRNCLRCGKLFRPVGGRRICSDCVESDRQEFQTVKEYLKNHPGAPIFEIAEATGVPLSKIREYVRDGRLVVGDEEPLTCERCKVEIDRGRFCASCAAAIARSLRTDTPSKERVSTSDEDDAPRRDVSDPPKKKITWNRFRRRDR